MESFLWSFDDRRILMIAGWGLITPAFASPGDAPENDLGKRGAVLSRSPASCGPVFNMAQSGAGRWTGALNFCKSNGEGFRHRSLVVPAPSNRQRARTFWASAASL
jgi:hypothetical protein